MTGPTSEPPAPAIRHTCELIERHSIVLPLAGTAALIVKRRGVLLMDRWCQAHHLELIEPCAITISDDDATLTISWTVTVGKGDIDVPVVDDPNEHWRWTWSARMQWWRDILGGMGPPPPPPPPRRQGRIHVRSVGEDGLASVTAIHRNDTPLLPPPLPPTCQSGQPWTSPWSDPSDYE